MAKQASRSQDKNKRLPTGSAGKRCYVIGDVHGRLGLVHDLIAQIAQHCAGRPARETAIVFLGDLIDRGPDSSKVIEFVRTFRPSFARVYCIAGNHEELMLRALDGDLAAFQIWLTNGGDATIESYGLSISNMAGAGIEAFCGELARVVPASHIAFLRSANDSILFGDYLLVHAGIRPGVALADQSTKDLRWIRKSFLESEADHGFVVVHGHSSKLQIEVKANRVGIDTGAYLSGVLTAMWIEDNQRGFLQTAGEGENALGDLIK